MEQLKDVAGDLSSYLSDDKLWNRLTKEEYLSSTSPTKMYHTSETTKYWDYIFPKQHKLSVISHMCLAVQELHSFNIVHCDLKPNNMLYCSKITLIDYGASQDMEDNKEIQGPVELGTAGYMAPEMIERKPYNGELIDLFATGVILFCMRTNSPPFD